MDRAETKHTAGPWVKCGGATPHYVAVHSADGYIVFGMADADVDTEGAARRPIKAPDMWKQQANARLIAAAPEMFEALREVVRWNGMRGDGDELLPPEKQDPEIAAAMRAIAKAEGLGQLADANSKEAPHV
jgi:hypothetical protein